MIEQNQSDFSSDKILDFLIGQITRLDKMSVSLANRAAMILSAGALILAGITFLADKVLSLEKESIIKPLISISVILTLLFTCISIIIAMTMIITWKKSKVKLVNPQNQPKPLFFHSSMTIDHFKDDFKQYSDGIMSTTEKQLIEYAQSSHWYGMKQFYMRYNSFAKSVRFLFLGIIAFLLSMILFFMTTIV